MKALLIVLALSWSGLGWTQTMNADELPEMCAAAYIFAGEQTKLLRWKGMFQLRSDVVLEYYQVLQQYEDADDLPTSMVQEAIGECDRVYEAVRNDEATSQASVVEGTK